MSLSGSFLANTPFSACRSSAVLSLEALKRVGTHTLLCSAYLILTSKLPRKTGWSLCHRDLSTHIICSHDSSSAAMNALNQRTTETSIPRRRSSSAASQSSSASTASQRARVPPGTQGSWNWGKAQPNKQELPILDITLRPGLLHTSAGNLAIVTAERTFGISDFGPTSICSESGLYRLQEALRSAKSSGQPAPLQLVENFRRKYPKVRFNKCYARLIQSKNWQADDIVTMPSQPSRNEQYTPRPAFALGAVKSVRRTSLALPPNERKIVKVDLLPLYADANDYKSIQITTSDGKHEVLQHSQADFETPQDAQILVELLHYMKRAAKRRDGGESLRNTASDFMQLYPRVDIVAKRLVKQS